MPGLDIYITTEDLLKYRQENQYDELSLKDWLIKVHAIPEHQAIESMTILDQDLSGLDLSFFNFGNITISDCTVDAATKFSGSSFKGAKIINTPIGHSSDIGYAIIVGSSLDKESQDSVSSDQLNSQNRSLVGTLSTLEEFILKTNQELEAKLQSKEFIEDPFKANVLSKFLEARTGHNIPPHKNSEKAIQNKIFALVNYHPRATNSLTFQEVNTVRDTILANIPKGIRLYPQDVERLKTICVDEIFNKIPEGATTQEIEAIVTKNVPALMHEWKEQTLAAHKTFDHELNIVANSKVIRERERYVLTQKGKSLTTRLWGVFTDAMYNLATDIKKPLTGAVLGSAAGLTQGTGISDKAIKAIGGAIAGAAAVPNIPKAISPFERSDWPTIDPKNVEARSRDIKLKLRGLFWCSMIAGGAIEGITGETLGISTMSTLVSSFSLIKQVLPFSAIGGNPDDPKNIDSFVSTAVQKLDDQLSNYSDKLDSQLGDKLLEIGLIMRELEPRLGIILANRKIMQITQAGSPGMLGNILTTGESIQNFVSFWALKNNYFAITQTIAAEKEKPFMERKRPGSEELDKKIEKKMWFKEVTLKSIVTVGILSVGITLGLPLFGLAVGAFGIPAAAIAAAAVIAVASIGYIVRNFSKTTPINATKDFLKGKKGVSIEQEHDKTPAPHLPTHALQTIATQDTGPSFVERLSGKRREKTHTPTTPKQDGQNHVKRLEEARKGAETSKDKNVTG